VKIIEIFKKNKLLTAVSLAYVILFIAIPIRLIYLLKTACIIL